MLFFYPVKPQNLQDCAVCQILRSHCMGVNWKHRVVSFIAPHVLIETTLCWPSHSPAAFPGNVCLYRNSGYPSASHNQAGLQTSEESIEFPSIPFVLSMQPVSWVGSSQLYLSQQPYLQLQGGAAALCLVIVPLKAHNLVFCFSQLYVLHFYLHAADKPEATEYIAFTTPPFVYIND